MKGSMSYIRSGLMPATAVVLAVLALAPTVVLAAPYAYLVNSCASCDNCSSGSVSVIDSATDKVAATVPVGVNPSSIAMSPDGRRAYVANRCASSACTANNSTVSVIDTATNSVVAIIVVAPGGCGPGVHRLRGHFNLSRPNMKGRFRVGK